MGSGAAAIKAGEAFVSLFAEDKALVRGLRSASDRIRLYTKNVKAQADQAAQFLGGIGTKMFATGSMIGGGMVAAAMKFASAGDAVDKMSARTGASAESLSELSYAAELCGASITEIETAILKTNKAVADAKGGNSDLNSLFGNLGVSAAALGKMSSDDRLGVMIDRIGRIKDESQQTAVAMKLFGDSAGPKLLPMIRSGKAGLEEMRDECRRLGLSMSQSDAASAAVLTDALTKLYKSFGAITNAIGSALAPELSQLIDWFTGILTTVIDWIRNNRALIVQIAKIAAIVVGVGAALLGIAGAITVFGVVAGAIGTVVSGAFGLLATILVTIGSTLAFLMSPIGLLTAAVVALAGYFVKSFGVVGECVDAAKSWFTELFEWATETWGGIVDAIAAGDLELAMQIVWTSLKVIWQTGINWLLGLWYGLKYGIQAVWDEAIIYIAKKFEQAWGGMQTAWKNTVATMRTLWHGFSKGIVDAWKYAERLIAQGIGYLIAKIKMIDPAEMAKNIDAEYDKQQSTRDGEFEKRIQSIHEELTESKKGIAEQQKMMTDGLEQVRKEREKNRQEAHNKETFGLAEELKQLQKQRDDAIKSAHEKKLAIDAAAQKKASKVLPAANAALEMASGKSTSLGVFSAFGVQSLQGNRTVDRIAKATEETAKHTKDIAGKNPVFKFA